MPIMEVNRYGLWVGKQTAKGTPNTTPSKRLVQVGGDFNMPRDDGSANYSDLTKYGATTDWVNSLLGNGAPAIEATPTELAYLLWLFHGAETVTAVTGPPTAQKHTFLPQSAMGSYFTAFVRVGQSIIRRHQYNDCVITQMVMEGSTTNKAVRVTPTILSLDPGVIYATDPVATLPTDAPFLYTDGTSSFTIDSVAFAGQSSFTLTVNDAWSPVFGDDTVPFEIVQGTPQVGLAVNLYFDTLGLAQFNKLVYGTASPTAGTKPLKTIPALGAYSFYLKQRTPGGVALNGREFKLTIPGVKWQVPDAPGPNPDGGASEVTLTGQMRPLTPGATNPYTIDVNTANADVAFTV